MSIEYTSHGNHHDVLEHLRLKLMGYEKTLGDHDAKLFYILKQLEGLSTPFYLDVDSAGDFWAYYDDGYGGPPPISLDDEGNVYWTFDIYEPGDGVEG